MKNSLNVLILLCTVTVFTACEYQLGGGNIEEGPGFDELKVDRSFNFETTQNLNLVFPEGHNNYDALVYSVTQDDTVELGVYTLNESSINLPAEIAASHIFTKPLQFTGAGDFQFDISGSNQGESNSKLKASNTYHATGTWNSQGVPDYLLADRDIISNDLLLDINATLPEGRPVPNFNPEYLNGRDMNTILVDHADVWVTFVHEGAGYRNVLGYFTYQRGEQPASIGEVDSLKIIFPNVSFAGSGGGLRSGDKVYLGRFDEGTVISWFLLPNAWDWRNQSIKDVNDIKYSINRFNDYTSAAYNQHTLVLNNEEAELLLLSFEDITRPGGDNDFNDAIFYVTANPFAAIETADLVPTKVAKDTDGDGKYDHEDDFPEDAERAFSSYWPGRNSHATILFEDQWPSIGDYDFNDLVADYNLTLVKAANGKVKELKIKTIVKAVGGLKKSSLLFNLGIDQSMVESVTGNRLEYDFIKTNANGTETGLTQAVIPIFDNSRTVLPPPAGYSVTNVYENQPHVNHVTIYTSVIFTEPVSQYELNFYDPFIVTEFNRGNEIHLPGQDPTSKANSELFGTLDDASDLDLGFTYKNKDGLPWALHVMQSIKYPQENNDFAQAYVNFRNWAESRGVTHTDWYQQSSYNMNRPLFYNR